MTTCPLCRQPIGPSAWTHLRYCTFCDLFQDATTGEPRGGSGMERLRAKPVKVKASAQDDLFSDAPEAG